MRDGSGANGPPDFLKKRHFFLNTAAIEFQIECNSCSALQRGKGCITFPLAITYPVKKAGR
jgi:hypothetical protein